MDRLSAHSTYLSGAAGGTKLEWRQTVLHISRSRVSAHRLSDKAKGILMYVALGTQLGRYEIRLKIGAGGMGEVYLA